MKNKNIIVALDYDSEYKALNFLDSIDPSSCRIKVGKEMFTLFGPSLIKSIHSRGFSVFLDLKFHDIPNTCANAVRAAAELGVWMVNVHASGGEKMMSAAKKIIEPYGNNKPLLIAVTVLTSFDPSDLISVGINKSTNEQVLHLAKLAHQCELDGVVCSALETPLIKQNIDKSFLTVTPGIRMVDDSLNDQSRVMSPLNAIKNGSDYLVIGRSITSSDKPSLVLEGITSSIQN